MLVLGHLELIVTNLISSLVEVVVKRIDVATSKADTSLCGRHFRHPDCRFFVSRQSLLFRVTRTLVPGLSRTWNG